MIQRSSTYIMSVERGMPMMMAPLYVEGTSLLSSPPLSS